MKLTSEELKQELSKQTERELYDDMVKEYLRVKKIIADSGALTHDECCASALELCIGKGIFDTTFRHR